MDNSQQSDNAVYTLDGKQVTLQVLNEARSNPNVKIKQISEKEFKTLQRING